MTVTDRENPVPYLQAAVSSASSIDSRMFSRSVSAMAAKKVTAVARVSGLTDPGQGPHEHLQDQTVCG